MRNWFTTIIYLFCLQSFAGYQMCPKRWVEKNDDIYRSLKKLEGMSKTGSCKLEIHLCTDSEVNSSDSLLGDVMISLNGRSLYVPLYVDQLSDSSSSSFKIDRWSLKYRFKDWNQDPLSGKTEKDELEFFFNRKTQNLESLVVRKNNRRDFTWFLFFKLDRKITCGLEE
jgi:hypothetical protein